MSALGAKRLAWQRYEMDMVGNKKDNKARLRINHSFSQFYCLSINYKISRIDVYTLGFLVYEKEHFDPYKILNL